MFHWRHLEDMSIEEQKIVCKLFLRSQQDAASPPARTPAAAKQQEAALPAAKHGRDAAAPQAADRTGPQFAERARKQFAKRNAKRTKHGTQQSAANEKENTAAPLPRDQPPARQGATEPPTEQNVHPETAAPKPVPPTRDPKPPTRATEPPPQRVQPETAAPKPMPPTRDSKPPTRATEPPPQRVQPETAAPKPVPPTRDPKPPTRATEPPPQHVQPETAAPKPVPPTRDPKPPTRATEPPPQHVQPETAAPKPVPPTRDPKPPTRATESPASVVEPYALPARDHEKHLRDALTAHVIPRAAVPGAPPEPVRAATTRHRSRTGRQAKRAQGPGCDHCIYQRSGHQPGHQHDCSGYPRSVVEPSPPETFTLRLAKMRTILAPIAACRTLCALCAQP
jgi:hypothetical protein